MRILSSLVIVMVLGSTTLAAAPDPKVVASVKTLLSGYEKVPTAADWAKAGTPEQVASALMQLATTERPVFAARATSSLGHFRSDEVRVFLQSRLTDRALHVTLRGKAAIALAGAFGDDAADTIAPLFAAPEVELREDAIRAFRRFAGTAADRFLLKRAGVEPDQRLADLMLQASGTIAAERMKRSLDRTLAPELLTMPSIDDPGPVQR